MFAQIEHKKHELALIDEREETLSNKEDILLEELVLREGLYKKGLSSKIVYLGIKRQVKGPYQTFRLKDGAKSSISIPQGQIIPMVVLILDEEN